jgi:hypothetical protein
MLNGQGWPGSAQLFRLGEALGEALPAGALVAMPVENMLFTLPIRSARALHMVPFILDTGVELTRGQQPLSTRMFWWHEGVLEELSVERTGPNDARVSGSGRFGQAMGSL